jgi:hypothetical protein
MLYHRRVGSCQNFILKANLRYSGFPEVLAGDLVDNLMEQIKQFEPGFTLGERAETIEKQEDGSFKLQMREVNFIQSGCNRRWFRQF